MQTVAGSFLWSRRSTELIGLPALAAAVLKSGLDDGNWVFERPDAVALWCEVGGLEVETFYKSLEGYARRKWVA